MAKCNTQANDMATTANNWQTPGASNPGRYNNAMYASTRWVLTVRHFLACEDVAGGSQQSGGHFFCEIRWPVRWVPTVKWRNHYFARNKEAFPCVRPWTQLSASPRIAYFRWCRSLTTLTTPRRAHQGGGRRRGPGQQRAGDGKTQE